MRTFISLVLIALLGTATLVGADEAPIAGKITKVDATTQTITVESAAAGRTRSVVIDVRPAAKVVRFTRGADGASAEQAIAIADLRPGWTVSVKTRHEGDREIAEIVRVVHER